MKNWFIVGLFVVSLLMVGCSSEEFLGVQNLTNESEVTNESLVHDVIDEPVVEEVIKKGFEEEPDVIYEELSDIDSFSLNLNNIRVVKEDYAATEEYELRMILSLDQLTNLAGVVLRFTPRCDDPSLLLVTVNGLFSSFGDVVCDELNERVISVDLFKQGNSILLQNKVVDAYELTDITVTLQYDSLVDEVLEADDYLFMPGSASQKDLKNVASVFMTNEVTRTFSLTEVTIAQELYLDFEAPEREGEVIIGLNDIIIYEGNPKKTGHSILLPHEHLVIGKNTLTFIGLTD